MGILIDEANRKRESARTRKSRTFTMTDDEYESITVLAKMKQTSRTLLLLDLVAEETKRLDDQV